MITDIFRKLILKKRDKFIFKGYKNGMVDFNKIEENTGLYIHIPFCKSICPYCPYNKVVYEKEKVEKYKNALLNELNFYKKHLKNKNISSIYIGGGTPTLLIDEIKEVLDFIKKEFNFNGDVGIEVYPTEVTEELLNKIQLADITLISLGIQTFNDDKLNFLGRRYKKAEATNALEKIIKFNFKCVDVDIMTNIPGQTIDDIENDLRKVYSYNIHQLSIYPLIIFPMTSMDRIIKEKKLSRFSEFGEKKILNLIENVSKEYGYERSSIWTYGKAENNRYTSVTRESFIGIGAGASSLFSNYFYLNTFNVDEYIKCNSIESPTPPINLVNTMTSREKMIFWIFWRCYDGIIDKDRFYELFNKDMEKEFKLLFTILKTLRMCTKKGNKIFLTRFGQFAYHYVEKQYSIYYLNYLWHESMKSPWIERLEL
ncbi:coproporphyrinogen-III oxidase family protein [Clostridium brassicae]|uniref:Heme chaperone HemW n=1 Tax=Clostridium brassicae TaxID=2999072 RepID=A0ABT4D4L0_9CLOT|nr:coproporphyrinogen-III oxidase family protein [Clostridium brassicae]MCY6957217.1 coproporphyrinogen-III oxidase family protein [Clostridium brassicae]